MRLKKPAVPVGPLLLAVVNGILTLGYYSLVVHRYGVGATTDFVFAVALLVNVLYNVTFGQLNEILVPAFVDRRRDQTAARCYWNVYGATLMLGGVFGLVLLLSLLHLAPRLYQGVGTYPAALLRDLLAIAAIYNTLFCALVVKNCYIVATGHPTWAQGQMAFRSGMTMLWMLWFGHAASPLQIIVAQTAGTAAALLLPVGETSSGRYDRGYVRRDLLDVWHRVRWLVANASFLRIEPLFDSVIASYIGIGAVTVLYLLQRIVTFVLTIVQNGYVLPFTVKATAVGQQSDELQRVVRRGVDESTGLTAGLLMGAALGLSALHFVPIAALRFYAGLFYEYGAVFALLSAYALGSMVVKIYATGLFVMRRERLFMGVSVASFVFALTLKITGASLIGLLGLAAGTAIGYALFAAIMSMVFRRVAANGGPLSSALLPEEPAVR